MKPPTDEVMCKIVAKQYRWVRCSMNSDANNPVIVKREPCDGIKVVSDPRTDPDAADELLHWVVQNHAMCVLKSPDGWNLCDLVGGFIVLIPISGEPKRTAICNLAASVLGVE